MYINRKEEDKKNFSYYNPKIRKNSCLYDSFFGLYGGLPFIFTEELCLNSYDEENIFSGNDIIEFFDDKIAKILVNQKNSLIKSTRDSFNFLHKKEEFNIRYFSAENTSNVLGRAKLGSFIIGKSSIFIL